MQIVELPLSAFSRKIMLAEYGGIEPITATQGDLLYQSLRVDLRNTNLALNQNKGTLNSHIQILVGDELHRKLFRSPQAFARVGVHLHKIHLTNLFSSISTAQRLGLDIKRAIKEYYDQHGLTDDDLGMDTAYRYWHREELKKKRKKISFFIEQRAQKTNFLTLAFSSKSRTLVADEIITEFKERYSTWAQCKRSRQRKNNRISVKKIETVSILTLKHVSGLNFVQIAKILNTSPENILQRSRKGIQLMQTHPKISSIYREILTAKQIECPFFLQ